MGKRMRNTQSDPLRHGLHESAQEIRTGNDEWEKASANHLRNGIAFMHRERLEDESNKRKHFRISNVAVLAIAFLLLLGACAGNDQSIEEINIEVNSLTMDIGEEKHVAFTIAPEGASDESLELESSEGITTSISKTNINIIAGKKAGNYKIRVKGEDIESNVLMIYVVDKQKEQEEKDRVAEENRKIEETRKIEEETRVAAEQEAARQAAEQQSRESAVQQPIQNMVWIASSGNGTKYHSSSSCSNMNNPIQLSMADAQARSYGPCKKCY